MNAKLSIGPLSGNLQVFLELRPGQGMSVPLVLSRSGLTRQSFYDIEPTYPIFPFVEDFQPNPDIPRTDTPFRLRVLDLSEPQIPDPHPYRHDGRPWKFYLNTTVAGHMWLEATCPNGHEWLVIHFDTRNNGLRLQGGLPTDFPAALDSLGRVMLIR